MAALGLESVRLVHPESTDIAVGHVRNVSIDAARGRVGWVFAKASAEVRRFLQYDPMPPV